MFGCTLRKRIGSSISGMQYRGIIMGICGYDTLMTRIEEDTDSKYEWHGKCI